MTVGRKSSAAKLPPGARSSRRSRSASVPFRLAMERPHALDGFQARLAAKVALHNFCGWLNHHLGRPMLAIADLIDW